MRLSAQFVPVLSGKVISENYSTTKKPFANGKRFFCAGAEGLEPPTTGFGDRRPTIGPCAFMVTTIVIICLSVNNRMCVLLQIIIVLSARSELHPNSNRHHRIPRQF